PVGGAPPRPSTTGSIRPTTSWAQPNSSSNAPQRPSPTLSNPQHQRPPFNNQHIIKPHHLQQYPPPHHFVPSIHPLTAHSPALHPPARPSTSFRQPTSFAPSSTSHPHLHPHNPLQSSNPQLHSHNPIFPFKILPINPFPSLKNPSTLTLNLFFKTTFTWTHETNRHQCHGNSTKIPHSTHLTRDHIPGINLYRRQFNLTFGKITLHPQTRCSKRIQNHVPTPCFNRIHDLLCQRHFTRNPENRTYPHHILIRHFSLIYVIHRQRQSNLIL
ncbi:hypothetical protein BC829DRAFT_398395, partial [Chytridium lagenaria]